MIRFNERYIQWSTNSAISRDKHVGCFVLYDNKNKNKKEEKKRTEQLCIQIEKNFILGIIIIIIK